MPPAARDPEYLLIQLEAAKNRFGLGAAARATKLLAQLAKLQLKDPHQLIRLHESLLFFRAFPQSHAVVVGAEGLLNTFHERIAKLRALDADMSLLDDFDASGIAGTSMQDILPFDAAKWIVHRIPRNVEISWDDYWDDYQADRARGNTWPRFIPLLEEDSDVEASVPWLRWLDAARGKEHPLEYLLRRFEHLPLSGRTRAELYDSLRLPVRWKLANLKLSRTRNWTRPRRFYFHKEPLLRRSQISLAHELALPAPNLEKLSLRDGESVMHTIREVMLVRYRELYGTTFGDPRSVVRADLGRGVALHLWNLLPGRRLPLRAYVAGFTLKNGVPINYVEAIGLCEWIEVGFNTFYTYRQGETAWIYAQALRCLCAFTGAKCISVYPYQIGQNNDEAIDSGAFWFYRKLGFRSGRADLEQLARREEEKIAAYPQYRTSRRILKRLAEAHVFYEFSPRGNHPGPWDTFSTRNLALRVNGRMAQEFGGESDRIRQASVAAVSRAFAGKPALWSPAGRPAAQRALGNWSLVLAMIPKLHRWTPREKQDALKIIRAQGGRDEMHYLRLTGQHLRLRQELLRLGSKS